MNSLSSIRVQLEQSMSKKRFYHSCCVADFSRELAQIHGADPDKAYLAGLVHDCCKEFPKEQQLALIRQYHIPLTVMEEAEPNIWHGYAASGYIREYFGITDDEVCAAVQYHTCGRGGMSLLEKIVFVADLTSADRNYPDSCKIHRIALTDLSLAIYHSYLFIIPFIIKRKGFITQNTLDCYNDAVRQCLDNKGGIACER